MIAPVSANITLIQSVSAKTIQTRGTASACYTERQCPLLPLHGGEGRRFWRLTEMLQARGAA
jgi:hypothetical protein